MSDKVKFISTDYLKSNTVIQDNVDENILVPYIYSSQDTHIQLALGSTLYDRLKDGIVNNNLNSDELNLLRTYIQPCLAQWAFYEVFPFLNFKMTNKAVSKQSSEFSAPSELDEIKYLRNSIRDLAEFFTRRLNQYLCDYSQLFPQYLSPDPYANVIANSKSYFSGVYTSRRGLDLFPDIPTYIGNRYSCFNCGNGGCGGC